MKTTQDETVRVKAQCAAVNMFDAEYLGHTDVRFARAKALPALVGKVYEQAPLSVRRQLLEHLLRPLGILARAAVAKGVFAKFIAHNGWAKLVVRPEDTQTIHAGDVAALASYVQQFSAQTIDELAAILSESPAASASTAASMLLASVRRKARSPQSLMGGGARQGSCRLIHAANC